MRNNERIIYGLLITIVVFAIATIAGSKLHFNIDFLSNTFLTHTCMLGLSIALIYSFNKYVDYKISLPKFKKILKPILFGLLATIIVNISMTILTKVLGGEIETHALMMKMSPCRFLFLYLSMQVLQKKYYFVDFL